MKRFNKIKQRSQKLAYALVLLLNGSICAAVAGELTIQVLAPSQQPVQDVVVYATALMAIDDLPVNNSQLIIDQANTKFAPYVTVLQKGQAIKFINRDDITHHIYSVSGENRFEFKIKAGNERMTQSLDNAEEVAMGCNIHDWMSGFALVVDTPFYGKTNQQGQVQFDLPAVGEYQITVWHPQLDTPENRVTKLVKVQAEPQAVSMNLPKKLLPIPAQSGQDEFEFLQEY